MSRPVVGVLGGGQLGRMLADAAAPLGVEVRLLDPKPDACGGAVAPLTVAPFDDLDAVRRFAADCDVVTIEFEGIPGAALQAAAEVAPVRPGARSLQTAQDRVAERVLFDRLGIPTPRWTAAGSLAELVAGAMRVPLPAVVKTRRGGYDGKGQAHIERVADAGMAWRELGERPSIVDERVPFRREISVVAVRSLDGEVRCYPLCQNEHRGGILHRTLVPAPDVPDSIARTARGAATAVAHALEHVGVLTVEFFELDGRLLANEMAPRVHNSGHWSIEFARTSQFENHLRAVLGWPLGDTGLEQPCLMANLVGRVPGPGELGTLGGGHVHLYGKTARPGRKVGHVSCRLPESQRGRDELLARWDALDKAG